LDDYIDLRSESVDVSLLRQAILARRIEHLIGLGLQKDHYFWRTLVDYEREHGHTHIPSRYPQCPGLADFCDTLRNRYHDKELPVEQVNYLETIGFVWDREMSNQYRIALDVVAHHDRYGDTGFSLEHPQGFTLYQAAADLRSRYHRNDLDKRIIRLLESAGFNWSYQPLVIGQPI